MLNRGDSQEVKLNGLMKRRRYVAVGWNMSGGGTLSRLPPVTADAAGTAPVTVPPLALVALSSRALGL